MRNMVDDTILLNFECTRICDLRLDGGDVLFDRSAKWIIHEIAHAVRGRHLHKHIAIVGIANIAGCTPPKRIDPVAILLCVILRDQ